MWRVAQTLVTFLAASLVPLIAFALAHRRGVEVLGRFTLSEIEAHQRGLLVTLVTGIVIVGGGRLLWRRIPGLRLMIVVTPRMRTAAVAAGGFLIAASGLLATPYVSARHRIFADVYFPSRALILFEQGRFRDAANVCRELVRLYPQRARESGEREGVCLTIVRFVEFNAELARYVSEHEPVPKSLDGVEQPVAWGVRREGLRLLRRLSGSE